MGDNKDYINFWKATYFCLLILIINAPNTVVGSLMYELMDDIGLAYVGTLCLSVPSAI